MNTSINHKSSNKLIILLILTLLALLPEYIIRSNLTIAYILYQNLTTYFGDLWYCFNNYLSQGFPFPREYPSGIQLIFRIISNFQLLITNYTVYMVCMSLILSLFALTCTYFLYLCNPDYKKLIIFWILAPSYLFYSLYNLDLIAISTVIISYYSYSKSKYYVSIIILALGTTIKVFPIFILPIYLLNVNNRLRIQLLLLFILSWLCFNLPFLIQNFNDWAFPYIWQIQNNYAKDMTDGSWTWILFQTLEHFGIGNLSGKITLAIFALFYWFLIIKNSNKLNLSRQVTAAFILFILTDRIYSPQYNLYILPCLVLVDYMPKLRYFYLLEIPNFIQGLFLFFIKLHPIILQLIIACKYMSLILLLFELFKTPQYVYNKLDPD